MFKIISRYVILVLLLGLIFLKFAKIGSDPPSFHVGHGQAQLTDPYHLTHFARNKVLFDDWNPFNYHRWDIFKYSLVSATSYIFFSTLDVSRLTSNLSATCLNIFGIFIFLIGLSRQWNFQKVLFTALILMLNSTLFFYGRYPFLENGLIFISGLTFFFFVRFYDRTWGQVITGILIALAALSGKLFGLILFGPVFLVLLFMNRKRVFIPLMITVASAIISGLIYMIVFFGLDFSIPWNYYTEQTVGMYGTPPGFSSFINFFKMLLTYGGESGLYEYTPFFVILTALSMIIMTLSIPTRRDYKEELIIMIFLAGWVISGILGLMPFKYRPLRYGLFLFMPMSAICAYAIGVVSEKKLEFNLQYKAIVLPLILFTIWYFIVQVGIFFSPVGSKFESGATFMPIALIIALVLTGLIYLLTRSKNKDKIKRVLIITVSVVGAAFLINQSIILVRYGFFNNNMYLTQYSKELGTMLGPNAVVTGPYGATLTIDNKLKNFIYMFGLTDVERNMFDKYKITHVATDQSNWELALKDFPFLTSATRIVQMPIRDIAIDIYRVPGADTIIMTDFEKGTIFLSQGYADSACFYFNRFNERAIGQFFAKTHLAYALMINGSIDESQTIIDGLLAERPDDYVLHGFCRSYYHQLYNMTGDNKYLELSQKHEARAAQSK